MVVQGSVYGKTATLSVVDRHGKRLHVEGYQNFPLFAHRPSYLLHRRVSQESRHLQAAASGCLSCWGGSGYSRSLLGECTETLTGLQTPRCSIEAGVHTPGTEQRGLMAERATARGCSSTHYTDPLDFVYREASVTVCALTCHMLHLPSSATCHTFFGNGNLAAPRD